jgi:hypothetical protein
MPKNDLHKAKSKQNYIVMLILIIIMTGLYFLSVARFGA